MSELRYRYPGVDFFTIEDADIFCGREATTLNLYTQIILSKTIVLHAESGTGKSSLINAGLIPLLKKKGSRYLPVVVKFNNNTDLKQVSFLIDETIACISKDCNAFIAESLPYTSKKENNLWFLIKTIEKNGYHVLLIFDQFEEIQTYSNEQILYFKENLSQLFGSNLPQDIFEEVQANTAAFLKEFVSSKKVNNQYNSDISFLESPLNAKAIFVVREDKLGVLSTLSDYFPDILKNDFVLKQLDSKNAKEAIMQPALKDGNFITQKFKFESPAVDKLLENVAEDGNELIDPMQLQIACSNIEKTIAKHKNIITSDDIPAMGNVINDFYDDSWNEVKKQLFADELQFNDKRKQVIDELVVNDKRRLVVQDDLVTDAFAERDKKLVSILTKKGLLRFIPGKDNYYQLCHDRFIRPLLEDKAGLIAKEEATKKAEEEKSFLEKELSEAKAEKERIELQTALKNVQIQKEKADLENTFKEELLSQKGKKVKLLGILSTLLILAAATAVYFAWKARNKERKADEENVLTTSRNIKKSNPSLSYKVAKDWAIKNKHSKTFDAFLKEFDSSKYSYLINDYSQLSSIVSANYNNKILTVSDDENIYKWNLNGVLQNNFQLGGSIVKVLELGNKVFYAVSEDDSLKIKQENGSIIKVFPETTRESNITVSKDGKYILINYTLYDFNTAKELGVLPKYDFTHDQMVSLFLNDSRHIVIGYWSGDIIIFSTEKRMPDKKDELKPVKMFSGLSTNAVITSLTSDNSGQYLAAGNRENTIQVWKIGTLNDSINTHDVDDSANKFKPVFTLKGHSNYINALIYSPDSKYILSGSDDNTAVLWDAATGAKLSILKGRDAKVNYVNFSDDGNTMITGTDDGRIYLWKRGKASGLYKNHELKGFSPFDYYALYMPQYTVDKVYDTSSIQNLFSATLNYISSIPSKNNYPEDEDYLKSLQAAITEVKNMYAKLTAKKMYKDSISISNKKLLSYYYNLLTLDEPELLMKTLSEDKLSRFKRFTENRLADIRTRLLLDTTDISSAVLYAEDFSDMAQYYLDSTTNYPKAYKYLMYEEDSLLQPFLKKYAQNSRLLHEEIVRSNYLVRYYLYTNHTDFAKNLCDTMCKNEYSNLDGKANMVLLYLVMNDSTNAKNIFKDIVQDGLLDNSSLASYLNKKITAINAKHIENKSLSNFQYWLQKKME